MDSPRDHAADANVDLSRKRPRLSEEGESPGSSSEPLRIEALEPEDVGNNFVGAIEVEDDNMALPSSYTDDFTYPRWTDTTPLDLIRHFRKIFCHTQEFLEPGHVKLVADWLKAHLATTEDQEPDVWLQGYRYDDEFFGHFAQVCCTLLHRSDDVFAENVPILHPAFAYVLHDFLRDLVVLCTRFVRLLPIITADNLSRRDSTQLKTGQHHITSLHYVRLLHFLLVPGRALFLHHLANLFALNSDGFYKYGHKTFLKKSDHVKALVITFGTLARSHKGVHEPWLVMDNILQLTQAFIIHSHVDGVQLEDVVETVNLLILPVIREKHPRALPDDFHCHVVQATACIINKRAASSKVSEVAQLYERFVKGDGDALLMIPAAEQPAFEDLWKTCDGDAELLANLVDYAWTLQTQKSFLLSEIIDVRTIGITLLTTQLTGCWRVHGATKGIDYPLVQYTSRFLRVNELTKYIFSAESHASLVNHSQDIVSFLAVTKSYTNQETDILWDACINSAEVEFAKASVTVLRQVCGYLEQEPLLYVAQQYCETPVVKLGPDIIDLLPTIFLKLAESTGECSKEASFATAFVSIDLLKNLPPYDHALSVNLLRTAATTELSKYTTFGADDRFEIYKSCISDLVDQTEQATSSAEVLRLFLLQIPTADEVQKLLGMLPISAAVRELSSFVTKGRASAEPNPLPAIIVRLDMILSLMDCAPDHEQTDEDLLYRFVFGELAPSAAVRDSAWKRLAHAQQSLRIAQKLMSRYLNDFVPSMQAKNATPVLIDLISESLGLRIAADAVEEKPMLLLHPLWKVLVRLATDARDTRVSSLAVRAICHLLFELPQKLESKSTIVQCQADFVRGLVDDFCTEYAFMERLDQLVNLMPFSRALTMLGTLLHASRSLQANYAPPVTASTIVVGSPDADDTISFQIQLYSSERHPKMVDVKAAKSAKIFELAGALHKHTGIAEHRVIAAGKFVDLKAKADLTLSKAGIEASGVIMISPKYTFDCDLNQVLTLSGPVEQAILEQYDRLESFVDAPESAAQAAYEFLKSLRPSTIARARVVSPDTTPSEILSTKRPYRTQQTLSVLKCHLEDFAKLGVVDEAFTLRTVRRLTAFIMDIGPTVESSLLFPAFLCLKPFLSEHLNGAPATPFFENPDAFAGRVARILSDCVKLVNPKSVSAAAHLTHLSFLTLLSACQKDTSVWTSLTQRDDVAKLHAELLLSSDHTLSMCLVDTVRNFCKEEATPSDAPDFYWRLIEAIIPKALERPAASASFFALALTLLHMHASWKTSESDTRTLVQMLVSTLLAYSHTESPELPMADQAALGLLRLLRGAMLVLKSFKKPMQQDLLAVNMFQQLLFPAPGIPPYQPLISNESRSLVFELVKMTCESLEDYNTLINSAHTAMTVLQIGDPPKFPGPENWLRAPEKCAGLENLGMTCYMNSLVQQLFANLHFRKFVFDIPVNNPDQQVLLYQVQELFAHMQSGVSPYVETRALANVLGVQVDSQEDVHGFFATFVSRLEDTMPDAQAKGNLSSFFTGKFISQIKGECGHVSTQKEGFIDVPITVKNKAGLQESLNEFVQGEPMQGANRYRCNTCVSDEIDEGRLVDAMKRTCFDEVPDNLTFCLKRFTYEAMMGYEGKVNDRFEFPEELDMAVYQRSHLESPELPITPDKFELVGVIVHNGTLEGGHYWSYVRLGGSMDPSAWFVVEDRTARPILGGIREVQEACFGGQFWNSGGEKTDSAYVLLYQRASSFHERGTIAKQITADDKEAHMLPPRVPLPPAIDAVVTEANLYRHRIANLFNPDFASSVTWLLEMYTGKPPAESEPSDDEAGQELRHTTEDLDVQDALANVAASFFLNVTLRDVAGEKRLAAFATALMTALEARPSLTHPFLKWAVFLPQVFLGIWRAEGTSCRRQASSLVLNCLAALKNIDLEAYKYMVQEVIDAHADLIGLQLEPFPAHWPDYVDFLAKLTRAGEFETTAAHKHRYLEWALQTIFLEAYGKEMCQRHLALWKLMKNFKIDMNAMFGLVHAMLNEHVFIPMAGDPESPSEGDERYILRQEDAEILLNQIDEASGRPVLRLLFTGAKTCRLPKRAGDPFYPALLAARLAEPENDYRLFRFVESTLLRRLDAEDEHIEPLLLMTLGVLSVRGEDSTDAILKTLTKTVTIWTGVDSETLDFWRDAWPLAPRLTIDNLPVWVPRFLARKRKAQFRQRTLNLAREVLFVSHSVQGDDAGSCDIARVHTTRLLCSELSKSLVDAYSKEEPRRFYNEMLGFMIGAREYLGKLHEAVSRLEEGSEDPHTKQQLLTKGLMVEYDESRSVYADVDRLLEELAGWDGGGGVIGSGAGGNESRTMLTDLSRSGSGVAVGEVEGDGAIGEVGVVHEEDMEVGGSMEMEDPELLEEEEEDDEEGSLISDEYSDEEL